MDCENQLLQLYSDLADFSSRPTNRNGSTIYHYFPVSVAHKILTRDNIVLRFTRSDCLNDPDEGNHAKMIFDYAAQCQFEIDEISSEYLHFLCNVEEKAYEYYQEDQDDDLIKHLYENYCLGNKYYLCCFSSSFDSLPMWNYYGKGDEFEGVNIAINSTFVEKHQTIDDNYDIWVSSVVYNGHFETCTDLFMKYKKLFEFENCKRELAYLFCCFLEKYRLVVKSNTYDYEHEIRAILRIKNKSPFVEKSYINQGFVKWYIDLFFDKKAYGYVRIGPLNNVEKNEDIIREISLQNCYSITRMKRSQIKNRF
jgi:hypothetical protein